MTPKEQIIACARKWVDSSIDVAEGSVFCASLDDEELETLIRKLIKARAMRREIE